ncbi:hypothetical protein RHSIM_Rhsim11G0096400 [Rhododendron simsii]|uniref:Pectinesterase catalytic domain-containing protein n=1 Tax=Rhododendron simsii TaxID=118357 RepID=A0A834GB47_RHOSS|nr:hypothetical protein RHSIM_Rhsim11G0096400 [Rhododendron simsii]
MEIRPLFLVLLLLLMCSSSNVSTAIDCKITTYGSPLKSLSTITVDKSGRGNHATVQEAVNSVRSGNAYWIRILVKPGVYKEKVTIPWDKECIVLEGSGSGQTRITWNGHGPTDTTATFTAVAANFVAKGIAFEWQQESMATNPLFITVLSLDFKIPYGMYEVAITSTHALSKGQWISSGEDCSIKVTAGLAPPQRLYAGYITAQGRQSAKDSSGFVFERGSVFGIGKAYLGRAYGPHSRVVFHGTELGALVVPDGWDAWHYKGSNSTKGTPLLQNQVVEAAVMAVVIVAQTTPSNLLLISRHSRCFPPSLWSPPPFRVRHRFSARRRLNPPQFASERLEGFNSSCSITNTEVFNPVDIEEEAQGEFTVASSSCSVQTVDIQSDILNLETEALNLLAEDTYVDTLLTSLPVLSEEEQNILAATPAHPAGLHALYASCIAGNLVEQLWNFAWPVAISLIHPSLLPVAVMGFFSKLAVIFGGPLVGKLMDHFPRVPAYNCLSIVQAAAQLLSVGMIIHAHTIYTSATSTLPRPWFVVLVLAGAIERLSGLALGVAMERDWVVLLAGTNRPIALAQANAVLNRIDLLCEVELNLHPILGQTSSCWLNCPLLKAETCNLCPKVVLTWLTNELSMGVLDRAKSPQACCRNSMGGPLMGTENIVEMSVDAIRHGWVEYMQQPVLPASLAYVLLCFNVVLAPGGLMTAFLTQQGLNPSIIGGFSGLCAFMGVAATFLSAYMVRRLGILKAGAVGLVLQAFLLTIAVAVYWSGSLTRQTPLLFFLCLIILSRLGHMSYDVVGAQILQTGIPESKANLIGTTEVSIASLAESVLLGVAIIANDVSHFGSLAMLSLLSVIAAALLFCRWLGNPSDAQRSLFNFDPQF